MRISMVNGQVFSEDQIAMVKAFDSNKKEELWELPSSSCCHRCKGGESSGPILYCEGCNVAPDVSVEGDAGSGVAVHFHCLRTPQNYRDCLWYCDKCCFSRGLKPGTIIEAKKKESRSKSEKDEKGDKDESVNSPSSNRKRKEQDRDRNGNGGEKETKGDKRRKERSDTDVSDNSFPFPSTDRDEKGPSGVRKARGSRGYVPVVAPGAISSINLYGLPSSHGTAGRGRNFAAAESGSDSDEEEGEDTMDYCFVCGDGGTLVLCDFPQCPRAYHQACIAPTFPQALDEAPNSACDAIDDPWFCPCHSCNTCGVLQATPNLDTKFLMLPKHMYTRMMEEKRRSLSGNSSTNGPVSNGMQSISALRQAKLTLCEGCPFSLCQACEQGDAAANTENAPDVAASSSSSSSASVASTGSESKKPDGKPPQSSFFNICGSVLVPAHVPTNIVYRAQNLGKHHCYCTHCSKPHTLTKLARVLEMAWSRMCQSRSALPFLVPFLQPGDITEKMDVEGSNEQSTSFADATQFLQAFGARPPSQDNAFVHILSKIRSLEYASSAQFVADVKSVRQFVQQASDCWAEVPEEQQKVPVNTEDAAEKALQSSTGPVGQMFGSGFLKTNHEFAPHPVSKYFPSREDAQFLLSSFDTALRLCESVLVEKKWLLTRLEGDLVANKGQAGARATDATPVDSVPAMKCVSDEPPASPTKKSQISDKISVPTYQIQAKDEAKNTIVASSQDGPAGTSAQVWRSECEIDLPYRDTAFPKKRTMTEWVTYLQGGSRSSVSKYLGISEIDTLNQSVSHVIRSVVNGDGLGSAIYGYGRNRGGSIDAGSLNNVIDSAVYNMGVNPNAFGNVYMDYDFRQFDAEKALYNLKGSSRAEDVTLIEAGGKDAVLEDWSNIQEKYDKSNAGSKASAKNKYTAADAAASSGNVFTQHAKRALKLHSDGNLDEYLATDETLVMLDRLKEMTRKTLHLEARLRREYLATKQFVRETGIEKVSIGEMSLIREMKLANDDLRWRMSQKNRALAASEAMVQHLQEQLQANSSSKPNPVVPPPPLPPPQKSRQ